MGNIGQVNYAASKAGLFGITQSMSRETAFKGINRELCAPGYIATEMVAAVPRRPWRRSWPRSRSDGSGASEIARAVQFRWTTRPASSPASVISVNGGMDM